MTAQDKSEHRLGVQGVGATRTATRRDDRLHDLHVGLLRGREQVLLEVQPTHLQWRACPLGTTTASG